MTQEQRTQARRRKTPIVLSAFAALILVPVIMAAWLAFTESGLRAAIELVRRVGNVELSVDGLSGRLAGPLNFDALRVQTDDLRLEVRGLALDWYPTALLRGEVDVDRLDIASIDVATRPAESTEPPALPRTGLPLVIAAQRITLGRLSLLPWPDAAASDASPFVLRDFAVTLSRDGANQRIEALQVTTPFGDFALDASVEVTAAPYPLSSAGRFRTVHEGYAVEFDYTLNGDLERLELSLVARGAGLAGTADAVLTPLAPMPLLALQAELGDIDPSLFAANAPHAALRLEVELGVADGDELLAGRVRVQNRAPARYDEGGLPFEEVTARLGWSPQRVEVSDLDMRISGGGRLAAQGLVELVEGGIGDFSANGHIAGLNPAELSSEVPPGNITLEFVAAGAPHKPVEVSWTMEPGRFADVDVNGSGRVVIDGERLAESAIDLTLGRNALSVQGAWGLPGDELSIRLDATRLESLGIGLSGSAKVDAVLSGTRSDPSGSFTASAARLVVPETAFVLALDARGSLAAGVDGRIELALDVDRLGPNAKEAWLESASLSMAGTRAEHGIDVVVSLPDDSVSARIEGGLVDAGQGMPDLQTLHWRGLLTALVTEGRMPVRLEAPAGLSIRPDRVVLEAARLGAGENGNIVLEETVWTPERITAKGQLTGLMIMETGRSSGRARRGPGPLVLGAEWDVELAENANGQVRVFRESGDISVPGELSARIGLEHLDLVGVVTENRIAVSVDARGTELGTVTGSITALAERDEAAGWRLAPDADLLGSVRMEMPSIAWMSRLLQDETVLEGAVEAEFSFSGTPSAPIAVGRIRGSELAIALVEHGVQLSGGELLAEFDRDYLRLTRLEFVSPNRVKPADGRIPVAALTATPGRLSASGEIALGSGKGEFVFEADRLPLLQRRDRWLIVSGKGEARSTWTTLALEASFRADAGYIEMADSPPPSLSDDVFIVGSEVEERKGGLKLTADVSVSLGDALYLSALGLETRLGGELNLRMRDGQPLTATGSIATIGGTYRGYGQSLAIERGVINFQGPLDNPGLNVVALRKGLPVEAGVAVTGSVRRPVIRLVSDPDVPDPDKLGWIVLGRAPSAGADYGLLLPAAQALLGGPGGGMTDQLSRSLGLDEIGIGQGEMAAGSRRRTSRVVGGGTSVGEANLGGQVLTLGKRLSSDLFLSFEQSLGGAESLVKLTYQFSRRVSVVARGGTDTSADVYYTISFR